MNTEFRMTLVDGRVIDVECESEVTYDCDCSGEGHDHIEAHDIVNVTDAYSGFELQLDDAVRDEIEKYADLFVHSTLEREAQDDEDPRYDAAV